MKTNQIKKPLWKRIIKVIMMILAGLFILLAITLTTTTIIHCVSLNKEAKQIKPYGKQIPVFDGKINVVDEGKGDQVIVLLPGQGTASPYYDFKPLIDDLKKENRVVTIEPFGYGLSTQTKRPRTIENYTEELHAVTEKLGLKKYIVMGHSITGLYAVNYAQTYASEMQGFIGIHTSTPEQPWPGIDMTFFDFLKSAGIFRAVIATNPAKNLGIAEDDPNFEQIRLVTMKNMSSRNMAEELQELSNSFPNSRGLKYPKTMPVLLFVARSENAMENWLRLHEQQIEGLDHGKVIELDGPHYLHHEQEETIYQESEDFIQNVIQKQS